MSQHCRDRLSECDSYVEIVFSSMALSQDAQIKDHTLLTQADLSSSAIALSKCVAFYVPIAPIPSLRLDNIGASAVSFGNMDTCSSKAPLDLRHCT